MRPKIFLAFVLAAILVVGAMVVIKLQSVSSVPLTPSPTIVSTPEPKHTARPAVVKKLMTPEEKQNFIEAEKDKLYEWSLSSDGQSYSNILADLISPEQEIRSAAIEAIKQFGDTNAMPVLKSLAANTQDNEEAIELLKAADFLALPSINLSQLGGSKTPEQRDAIAANKAKAQARRIADQQKHDETGTSAADSQTTKNQSTQP